MKAPSYKGLVPASEQASIAKRHNQGVNTRHEALLRRGVWRLGYRYRKNVRTLPGRPDIVFPTAKLAVFCDGDFWHGRQWKKLRQHLQEGTNAPYWTAKIARNRERDQAINKTLRRQGWRVLRLWETEILADPTAAAERIRQALDAIH